VTGVPATRRVTRGPGSTVSRLPGRLLGALLLAATVAGATDTSRTPTLRPNAADLSLAVFLANPSDPLRWFHGRTATQVQRDAVESALTGIAMPRVIQFAKHLPGCASSLGYLFTNYSKITAKLGPLYEAQEMKTGFWNVTVSGRHYHFEHYNERKVRDCATSNETTRRQCAAILTPEMGDYLDLHVEAGRCVQGAGLVILPPAEPFDTGRGVLGMVRTKTLSPKPDGDEQASLEAALAAHNALSPNTGLLRRAAEDTADDEAEHHRFRTKDFLSDLDPAWTPAEVMRLHAKQNASLTTWEQAVVRGDWFAARQADTDHQLWHICAAVKDDRLLVLFACPAGLGDGGSMDRCPITTCSQALGPL
jgi:hypothetical protein